MANKKYYWLKLKNDFFTQVETNFLLSQKNGSELLVTYLRIALYSVGTDAVIRYRGIVPSLEQELALAVNSSTELVKRTLELLLQCGLAEYHDENTLFLSGVNELVGIEGESTHRVRAFREKSKKVKCETQCNADETFCNADETFCNADETFCNKNETTEKEIEIEKEKDTEKEPEKDKDFSSLRESVPPAAADTLKKDLFFDFSDKSEAEAEAYDKAEAADGIKPEQAAAAQSAAVTEQQLIDTYGADNVAKYKRRFEYWKNSKGGNVNADMLRCVQEWMIQDGVKKPTHPYSSISVESLMQNISNRYF